MPHWQWRSVSAFLIGSVLISASLAVAQQPTPPPKQAIDTITNDLEQLMKIEIVVAGSKRAQESRDVASFVSVVTAAEIREHGYRTLADVLRTLPGFYVSNDRNYSYIGVRGFSRPGDWNSRVLLLLNGLRTNDNVYDLAYIGEEFSVDVDLIERVEVIRGPSSAIYGSNAFFAVINVVTRPGSSLAGTEIATSAASFGTYSGRASYGHTFANGLDLLVSGLTPTAREETCISRNTTLRSRTTVSPTASTTKVFTSFSSPHRRAISRSRQTTSRAKRGFRPARTPQSSTTREPARPMA